MRLLQYKDLNLRRVRPAFDKLRAAIEAGDFRSADVKKLHVGSYYRAKLDYTNRLLLQFAHIDGETVCLALEVIENHRLRAQPLSARCAGGRGQDRGGGGGRRDSDPGR